MSKISIEKKDIVWSYIGNFLKLAINIILLPIILKFLSDDELGMWYVFASIGQMAILLDFGFAPALARNISYVWCGATDLQKENIKYDSNESTDIRYFKVVLTTSKLIYLIIAIVAFVLMLSVGTLYIKSLTNESRILYSWIIYSGGVFLNILYSYYTSFLRGVGAIAENNKAGVFSKVTQIIVSVVLLLYGFGLLGVSVAYFISGLILRISSKIYFERYEGIGEKLSQIKVSNLITECFSMFRVIWYNASKDGLVTLSNYLSTQANTLISSSVLGLSATGSYGLAIQISTIISTVSGIPYSSFLPQMQEAALKSSMKRSKDLFSTSIAAYSVVFFIGSVALFAMMPILLYFKPTMDIDYSMFAVILLSMYIYQLFHLSASYISTFNILPYARSFIISSLGSVALSYIITTTTSLGLWGLIISPLIVYLLYNAWKWPSYALGIMKISAFDFIKEGHINLYKNLSNKLLHRNGK